MRSHDANALEFRDEQISTLSHEVAALRRRALAEQERHFKQLIEQERAATRLGMERHVEQLMQQERTVTRLAIDEAMQSSETEIAKLVRGEAIRSSTGSDDNTGTAARDAATTEAIATVGLAAQEHLAEVVDDMEPEPEVEVAQSPPEGIPYHPTTCIDINNDEDIEFQRWVVESQTTRDDDEPPVLVIDAGRLLWRAGTAGDDAPKFLGQEGKVVLAVAEELQRLRNTSGTAHAQLQLLQEHQDSCCTHILDSITRAVEQGDMEPYELAVVTLPWPEAPNSDRAFWLRQKLFDGLPTLRGVTMQHQEVLQSMSSGRHTSLIVNLGLDITIAALYEGCTLPGARAVRNPRYDLLQIGSSDCPEEEQASQNWMERSGLLEALEAVVAAAPVNTRRDLLRNIVIAGGLPDSFSCKPCGLSTIDNHAAGRACQAHLSDMLWHRLISTGYPRGHKWVMEQVICPPERAWSSWIGGSILGSHEDSFNQYPTSYSPDGKGVMFLSRERHEALVRLGSHATSTDVVRLLGASRHFIADTGPDLRPNAARRALAWACCLLPCDVATTTIVTATATTVLALHTPQEQARSQLRILLRELPPELVTRVGILLVHPPEPTVLASPEERRTEAELVLLMAPRQIEQGKDCEEQSWSKDDAQRVTQCTHGRWLARDRGPGRIRVMCEVSKYNLYL